MPMLVAPTLQTAGFRASGITCGLKSGRPDLGLLVNDGPQPTAAAIFTRNACAAAPVHLSRQHVADGDIRAVVVNSGNANACTGRQGLRDALEMAGRTAERLGIRPEQVLVCSTGIIGRAMEMDKVRQGIDMAFERLDDGGEGFQNAILTTDSGPKTAETTFEAQGITYRVQAVTKGAGMIHPNMGTMLSFVTTDAPAPTATLRQVLSAAADATFNQISVDGDESTNDTVALLASGAAGGRPIQDGEPLAALQDAVTRVCRMAGEQIVADGEGTTRVMHFQVTGAPDTQTARRVARAVVSSTLVKCALHGADPNWGRITAAAGQAWRDGDPTRWSLHAEDVPILVQGEPQDPAPAAAALQVPRVTLTMDLAAGDATGEAWGCDLNQDYVEFNSRYST